MATTQEYAQLSLYVYNTVNPENRPTLPQGWTELEYQTDYTIGLSYGVFQRSGTNEIVLAYTGSNERLAVDFAFTNFPAGFGLPSAQIPIAALVYQQVRERHGNNITLSGHSLGGGLASVMAVWFDRPAVVFDEAPFQASAASPIIYNLTRVQLALSGYSDPAMNNALSEFTSRENRVTNHYLDGEVLEAFRTDFNSIYGNSTPIQANIADMTAFGGAGDLHSQALLTAMLMSDAFRQSTYASTRVLPQLLNSSLYHLDAQYGSERNILVDLIRSERNSPIGQGKLTRFATDLQKLGAHIGGLNKEVQDALIAQAIEWYYWQDAGQSFFGEDNSLLQYATAKGDGLAGAENRAASYVQKWLAPIVNAHGEFYTSSFADYQQWNVATGSGASGAALGSSMSQIFVGNDGADSFTGGQQADLMFAGDGGDTLTGNDGDDRLYGGLGSDTLNGGAGYDRYVIEGSDTVEDSDGDGILTDRSGKHISGIVQKLEDGSYVSQSDSIVSASGDADLTLALADGSSVTIKGYQDGDLSIQFFEEEALATDFDRTIVGDLVVGSQQDDIGNYVPTGGDEPGRDDGFHDSTGNDLIKGLEGNDFIYSWRGGDDQIEGGEGKDLMVGGMGKDIVVGGADRDVLVEGGGDDKLYADSVVTLEAAIAAGEGTGSGQQGEALSGGDGNDLAIGGTGNDVLFGGTGDDILVAGAGNDDIDGDAMAGNIMADWSVQRNVTTTATGTSYNPVYNQFNMDWPTVGGDDVIYAGAGEDWVMGGYGNDVIDGGNDADKLWGEGGSDDVFGGAGNDLINGDNARLSVAEHGDDYLDGEDGDDQIFGEGGSDMLFGGAGNDKLYADNADNSGAGYDTLDGEAGDDELLGGALDDELFGGEGNDFLQGDSGTGSNDGDDYLDGEAGDDILLGEGGQDEIHGGDGADQIAGDNGGDDTSGDADTLYGDAGNDTIDGQGGDDVIDGGADNDLITGNVGNDLILGGKGDDQLQGGDGDDVLDGGNGNDILFGEAGNDTLRGGDGTDYLLGGTGDDALDGGVGDDVYYYSLGEGNDHISDAGGTDWLVFTDINWGQITLGTGSLKLNLPDGSELHLDDFDPDNPYAAGGIEYFQFADGSVLTKNQLINALGIQPTGTPEADMLAGTALAEIIHALAGDDIVTARAGNDSVHAEDGADIVYGGDGNDIIHGGNGNDVLLGENGDDTLNGDAGNDLLSGGAGTDAMQGGDGDDAYLFQSGDGQDTATDTLGANAIVLGSSLTLDAVVFTRQSSDLLVAVKSSTDRLTVKDWFAADSHFASITLGDGTTLDHAGVEAAMPRNQAPVATQDTATVVEDGTTYVTGNALANDSDPEGRTLQITNAGTYTGTVGTLSLGSNGAYSYTLANGGQAVQSLAAGQTLTDTFAYTVTDGDPSGAATATSSIRITVQGANDLPTMGADSAATAEDAGPISGNVLANDSDIDAGTTLMVVNPGVRTGTYGSLTLGSDGAWGYSLANTSTAVQSLAAGQTVTDSFSFNVSDGIAQVGGSLSVGITGQNDAPILVTPLADQSASANSSWSWQVPVGSFADVDAGDVLGYTATLADGTALPTWLAFDAATQTFSSRVPKSATGSIDIRITATDRQGAAAADVLTLSFVAGSGGGGGGGGNTGGGSQGNEGVGNGVDGPPPGHDTSFNDGAGTGPGNPGAQGGNGYVPPKRADILVQGIQIDGRQVAEAAAGNERGNSADAHAAAPGQAKQDSDTLAVTDGTDMASNGSVKTDNRNATGNDVATSDAASSGQSAVPQWLQEAAWTYLDTQGSDASHASTGNGGDTVAAFMQWLAVQQAMADQSRNGLPDWLDVSEGADLRGMLLTDGRFLGSDQAFSNDPLSLLAGASLKTFNGLGSGTQKIA